MGNCRVQVATRRFRRVEVDAAALHRELVGTGLLEKLAWGGEDERLWADCDLASLAENRLADRTDPRALTQARRDEWRARATSEAPWPPSARKYENCYWLVDGNERVGTVALSNLLLGSTLVGLSSLYVFPTFRGRGVATRALAKLRATLAPHELGIKLETNWSWQPIVKFYLRLGLWVHMWKRDLAFRWDPDAPPPIIELGPDAVTLSVEVDQSRVMLARAERAGTRLVLTEHGCSPDTDERIAVLTWQAPSTLSLWLALQGWPLIRSSEAWDKYCYADGGAPEALASKIVVWEAWDRAHGWQVQTPRIPGLTYSSWEELEASWNAESAAIARPEGEH